MPRWASRIQLEITNVRVERVQEISAEDCLDEGIDLSVIKGIGSDSATIRAFHELWDSINGKKQRCSWSDNPWTWIVEFKVVK